MSNEEKRYREYVLFFMQNCMKGFTSFFVVLEFVAIVASLLFASDKQVPLSWLLVAVLVFIGLIASAIYVSWKAFVSRYSQIPRVRNAIKLAGNANHESTLLLVENSDLFASDSYVEIFLRLDEFEELIGIGLVSLVQQDGLIQVRIVHIVEHRAEELSKCQEWGRDKLGQLIVRPTFSFSARSMMEAEMSRGINDEHLLGATESDRTKYE